MLVGIIAVDNVINAFQQVAMAELCDAIELRLDYLDVWEADALQMLFQSVDKPIIATLRKQNQGGHYNLGDAVYQERLRDIAKFNPTYLDIEIDVDLEFVKELKSDFPGIKLLRSCHVLQETPEELEPILDALVDPVFDEYKLVTHAKTVLDTMRLMAWAKDACQRHALTCFAIGEHGQASRVIAPAIGSRLSYTVISNKVNLVPGQINYQDAAKRYRLQSLNTETRIYALLGDPVSHSVGHIVHNALYQDQNLNAVYMKIQVTQKQLPDFMAYAKSLPFYGFSVTAPLKQDIVNHLQALSEETKEILSVNTVTREKDDFLGFNTDGIGALDAIESRALVYEKSILVLGAGGAARAIIYEAQRRGAKVTCVNRTLSKAKQLANGLGCQAMSMDELKSNLDNFQVIINTIPSQLSVIGFILPKEALGKVNLVLDCNYYPHETALLRQSKNAGAEPVYGIEMFINQAIAQMDIWFHEKLNRDGIRGKLLDILNSSNKQEIAA